MALMLFDWLTRDGRLLLAAKLVRSFAYGFGMLGGQSSFYLSQRMRSMIDKRVS